MIESLHHVSLLGTHVSLDGKLYHFVLWFCLFALFSLDTEFFVTLLIRDAHVVAEFIGFQMSEQLDRSVLGEARCFMPKLAYDPDLVVKTVNRFLVPRIERPSLYELSDFKAYKSFPV